MMMRKIYQTFGALLLLGYSYVEWTGWEFASNADRSRIPPGARNVGGYRTYHFWSGGK